MADVQIAVTDQQNTQIAVIDQQNTQIALAAPSETQVDIAVPGVQGPTGQTGDVAVAQDGTASTPGIRFENDTNTGIYRPGADQLAISTNGTGRLFVDANGNVGVGIATPSARLHSFLGNNSRSWTPVAATSALFERNAVNYVTIEASSASTSALTFADEDSQIIGSIRYNHPADYLGFDVNGSERLRITSDGKLGLGTSAPAEKLDLVDGTGVALRLQGAGTDRAKWRIRVTDNGSNGLFQIDDYSGGAYSTNLTIADTGRVGVGTSAPNSPLHIANNSAGTADAIELTNFTGNSSYIKAARSLTLAADFDANSGDSESYISFETDALERARIDSSGRLLVGTSSATDLDFKYATLSRTPAVQINGTFSAPNFGGSLAINCTNELATLFMTRSDSVAPGYNIGTVIFGGNNTAGNLLNAAWIQCEVDSGTVGTGSMPGRLLFSTTADGASSPTERMRIDNAGNVAIGTAIGTEATTNALLRLGGTTGRAADWRGLYDYITFDAAVTGNAIGVQTRLATAAASFNVDILTHFYALQATLGAGSSVTNQIGFLATSSLTGAANNFGFYSNIAAGSGRWNFYASGTAANYFAGTIASLGSYNDTTASAANVFIASNGDIQRSTSSIRYKTDVEDLDTSYADNVIFNARPVWYRSLCEADNAGWSYYGLIAEELAELDPRLVFWGRPTKKIISEEAKPAVLDDEGNEIEPAQEASYTNVEDINAELRPEGVQYDRLTVMLIDVVQRQQKTIEALEARVAALEAP